MAKGDMATWRHGDMAKGDMAKGDMAMCSLTRVERVVQ